MIVYGDRDRSVETGSVRVGLRRLGRAAMHALPGLSRREICTELVIETGALSQGILDWRFQQRGCDDIGEHERACALLCTAAGQLLVLSLAQEGQKPSPAESWTCGLAALELALEALGLLELPSVLELREPEGYAYYGLYPELYAAAARELAQGAPTQVQVIGIRSIGTSLAGVVCATLGARAAWTVRPVGHPFARTLRIGARLRAALLHDAKNTRYAIVDEGPGLSGSSFAAVSQWLLGHGVEPSQICFLPSHPGAPGARCAARFRGEYLRAQRYHKDFQAHFGGALPHWFEDILGAPLDEPPRDVSGGSWRALLYERPAQYPRSYVPDERRKYLLKAQGSTFLMKFAGLGATASTWLDRVRALGASGLSPPLCGARYGFTLTPWLGAARPLDVVAVERTIIIDSVARYLTFLAERFPVPARQGAGPDALLQMARHNLQELFGGACADTLERFTELLPSLNATHRPIATDNKLDAYEWLYLPDGRLLKADALEHSHAHDLIGCQDLAWDVAGAFVELGLGEDERETLLAHLRDRGGLRFSADKLHFFQLVYLAFRAGHATQAEGALSAWPADAQRMKRAKRAYTAQLQALLAAQLPKISLSSRSTSCALTASFAASGSHT
jgi:hypothetical protein